MTDVAILAGAWIWENLSREDRRLCREKGVCSCLLPTFLVTVRSLLNIAHVRLCRGCGYVPACCICSLVNGPIKKGEQSW